MSLEDRQRLMSAQAVFNSLGFRLQAFVLEATDNEADVLAGEQFWVVLRRTAGRRGLAAFLAAWVDEEGRVLTGDRTSRVGAIKLASERWGR